MDPIVLKTFLVPNYTKLMPENMVPGQKVKKVIFTGFSPPPNNKVNINRAFVAEINQRINKL